MTAHSKYKRPKRSFHYASCYNIARSNCLTILNLNMGNRSSHQRPPLPLFEEDPLKYATSCILQKRYKALSRKLKKTEVNWSELIKKRLERLTEGNLAGIPPPVGLDAKELPLHSVFSMYSVGKYTRKHLKFVKLLLRSGYDPNLKDAQGLTGLHHVIQRLLGFDINQDYSSKSVDAYWYAYKIVDVLCTHGADANVVHPYTKQNSLHLAAKAGLYESITTLISHGCKVETLDFRKRTPLVVAVENSSAMCVRALLKHGFANAAVKTSDGQTLLHYAMVDSGYSMAVLQSLLPLAIIDINAKNNKGDTALHLAARRHLDQLIIELIRYGADTDIRNKKGRIPLFEYLDNASLLSNPNIARIGVGQKIRSSRSFQALVENTTNPSWAIHGDFKGYQPNLLADEHVRSLVTKELGLQQPTALKHMCRLRIRSSLGIRKMVDNKKHIHSIGIPRELENYISSEKYKKIMHATKAWK